MRQPIVIGNWKMNGNLSANETLLEALLPSLEGLEDVQVALCPPSPYLAQVERRLQDRGIALGAQTLNEREAGAHTGEVSAAMLKDLGCYYVLIGHSERRSLYGETDAAITAKCAAAKAAGLVPVLCVGETLDERPPGGDAGRPRASGVTGWRSIQAGVSLRLVPARPMARQWRKRASWASSGRAVNSTVSTPWSARASMTSVEPVRSSP